MLTPWQESYDQARQHIKKQRHYFCQQSLSSQIYGFSSSHVWMWELDYKEGWALKNPCLCTLCWRRLLRVLWTARRSNLVHPKGNQSWIFIGRTDAEAETPIFWPPDVKGAKTLMLGKIEGRRRRGQQRMRWLDGIIELMKMSLSEPWVLVKDTAWN